MIEHVYNAIQEGLYEHTKLFVVDTDNPNLRPKHPFYSFKIINMPDTANQTGAIRMGKDGKERIVFDNKLTVSVNVYSSSITEAQKYIMKAWEWFKWAGGLYLNKENIVVVRTLPVQDRTINLSDEVEYRLGFDVELRVLHEIVRDVGIIEKVDYKGGITR